MLRVFLSDVHGHWNGPSYECSWNAILGSLYVNALWCLWFFPCLHTIVLLTHFHVLDWHIINLEKNIWAKVHPFPPQAANFCYVHCSYGCRTPPFLLLLSNFLDSTMWLHVIICPGLISTFNATFSLCKRSKVVSAILIMLPVVQ